jgi:uncharacterized protein YqeY
MLIDDLKKRMFAAIKANDVVEKELFRTIIGEVTRTGEEATDEKVTNVLRKMVKSTEETLGFTSDAEKKAVLERERGLLESFLPKGLSADDVVKALAAVADQVRAAGNDGQATGVAMKHLKAQGLAPDGKTVALAVKQLRS